MKLNLSDSYDLKKFNDRSVKLIEKGANIDLTEHQEGRTVNQNSFVHVVFNLYAIETGLTKEEAKTDLKRECPFMRYEKNGKQYLKKTSKMDIKELSVFIKWAITYAAINGIFIPTSEQYKKQSFNIDKEIESNKNYL